MSIPYKFQHPLYRRYKCLKGTIIVLEGLIGAGKSTLGQRLVEFLRSINLKSTWFPEFKNQKLLDQYLSNMQQYAYDFQVIMVRERINVYKHAFLKAKNGSIVFIDRSILGDLTFAEMQHKKGFISDDEFDVYLDLIKCEHLYEPDLILFLECNPETCMNRLLKRDNRSEVSSYNLGYLNDLLESYNLILVQSGCQVYRHKWDESIEIPIEEKKCCEILDLIVKLILKV